MGESPEMTIRWKVALIEDDRRLARAVSAGLDEEGYTVRAVDSASRGLELVRQWNPDVVLLDLMLPDNEGPELFEAFRAETDAALVGISARSSVSDRIAGLKMGADDYVAKPFALEELLARVEAVIRRHRGKGGARLVVGDVTLDLSEGIAARGSRKLILTGIEFRILAALMRSPGQLVTYAQLAEAVWAVSTGPESNSLEVHVSRIRQKLENGGESRLIQTVRGIGYRFMAQPKEEVST
jgi:two-component system response regulator MprA